MPEKLPSVQEHAASLIKDLQSAGKIDATPDQQAQHAADVVPAFSKNTRAIDPNTGLPIDGSKVEAPEFSQGGVALPEDTETTGSAAGEKPHEKPTEALERDPKTGQFVGEKPPEGTPTPAQAAGTEAAEKAAAEAAQAVEDMDDYEFEDPDFEGIKIPLKYPKKYAGIIKRAIPRQSDYHRIRNRWGEAQATLEPLLNDGRFARILPLIQRAMSDEQYGEFVWQAYQRAQQGLPLLDVPRETRQQEQAPAQVPLGQEGFADPLLEAALNPVMTELNAMKQRLHTQEQQQQESARRQQQLQAQQNAAALQAQAAHRDLATMFPGGYKFDLGPNDPAWQLASKYAVDAGYVEAYGLRGGVIFAAQQLAQIEADRLAATASPAAAALASVDQKQVELARQQAAKSAASVGGGAPHQAPPPAPKAKPTTKAADGRLKSPDEFMREMAEYLQPA